MSDSTTQGSACTTHVRAAHVNDKTAVLVILIATHDNTGVSLEGQHNPFRTAPMIFGDKLLGILVWGIMLW